MFYRSIPDFDIKIVLEAIILTIMAVPYPSIIKILHRLMQS